jgi:hypothetical protein
MTIEKDIYQDHKNYIDNGYKDRSEYLKHLSEYFMIPHASVCAIAEVLGSDEDFDALLCELEDFDYLLGIHCNMPIDDVDPAWYINPQFIGR